MVIMIDKEKYLWKRGAITLDDNGFHIPDDERGVMRKFVKSVLSDDLEGRVDEVFTRHADIFSDDDGDTFSSGDDIFAYPLTEIEDLDDFMGWLENTPEDWEFIKQEEIWAIKVYDFGVQAIRGEDLRYLVHEARKVWAEQKKKIRHRTWWKR